MEEISAAKSKFAATLKKHGLTLDPLSVRTMQLNITRQCNQSCVHCHVDASPSRDESMSARVIGRCLEILAANPEIEVLDITGGAPELHPLFPRLVSEGRKLGKRVMVRHNLTVTFDENLQGPLRKGAIPEYFARNAVEVIASLPYYQEYFTDRQRGPGVFEKSIAGLKLLNNQGYGREGSGLTLTLVYNPAGAFIPAGQASIEKDFRRELQGRFGVCFNHLFAITNMPVNRFKTLLEEAGIFTDYMQKLVTCFNPDAALNAMCRSQVSIGPDGKLYDCDFNQALGLQISGKGTETVFDFAPEAFMKRDIIFGPHCFGCTAGAGSSCGGSTT
jgi:radical SAM/Cys-rich protein